MYAGLIHDGTPIYVHNTVIKIPNTQLPTYWISHGDPCSARCSIPLFLLSWLYKGSMMEDVHMKLNPGLPWQKLHSARRRLFLPANWT